MKVLLSVLFLSVICGVWLWDAYCTMRGDYRSQVSQVLLEWSVRWPIIPFAIGVVVGHLFWPQRLVDVLAEIGVPDGR